LISIWVIPLQRFAAKEVRLVECGDEQVSAASRRNRYPDVCRRPASRGPGSFHEAFEDAIKVAEAVRPREIRLRWHPGDDSYTWSIEY
jgi:hypothetical protein